jgi:hypothetical protein
MTQIARKVPLICIATVIAALALAPSALANSSVTTYAGNGGNAQANIQSGGPGTPSGPGTSSDPSAKATGALPFTGFDLTLAFGGALLLLAGGASIAALTSRNQRAQHH